ncbi:hypothetical protein BDW22DRAFT_1370596 [Trametopsis cervina]|nr:hypothetical protein BDW22DRAFT_1370596 [Trametopsis cervina]
MSHPDTKQGSIRWHGFFRDASQVQRVLKCWTSSRTGGHKTVQEWAVDHVGKMVASEGNAVTADGVLQTRNKPIDNSFVLSLHLPDLYEHLQKLCPAMFRVMHMFCTTRRQNCEGSDQSAKKRRTRVLATVLELLGQRSQQNSWIKYLFGLYLYATGTQRQTIAVLSSWGVCSSYTTLAGSQSSKTEQQASRETATSAVQPPQDGEQIEDDAASVTTAAATLVSTRSNTSLGLIRRLSQACTATARNAARAYPLSHVYDNINFMFKASEQVIGRKDSQENGTCATAVRLIRASLEDMKTADLLKNMLTAPELAITDVIHNQQESRQYHQLLVHTILRIIVAHGGPSFERFRKAVATSLPVTEDQIPLHKSEYFPLPTMNIDESSTVGNAEVIDAISNSLGYDRTTPEYTNTVKIYSGDQLSMARLRTVGHNRLGHDALCHAHINMVQATGHFHGQMHVVSGCLETHWGLPSAGVRDPGSLSFHNTVLDRKPILLSSPPPYQTCRDLVSVSLFARILKCLEIVAGTSLAEYPDDATFIDLKTHAEAILNRFANTQVVDDLRNSHSNQNDADADEPKQAQRDIVLENGILFNRDALIMRELNDAIKAGDSGRILLSLKILAPYYRGSKRTKYAYESLVSLHNLTHVWPVPLRRVVMNNWLVNTTGRENGFIPLDLLQEHQNFWIKKIYSAQGPNASWEWLEMVAPCINILRELVSQFHGALGAHQGSKHAAPDLSNDIHELMRSLELHQVYTRQPNRTIEDSAGKSGEVRDILTEGFHLLSSSINDYNLLFKRLRARRALSPLITDGWNELWGLNSAQPSLPSGSDSESDSTSVTSSEAIEWSDSDRGASDAAASDVCSNASAVDSDGFDEAQLHSEGEQEDMDYEDSIDVDGWDDAGMFQCTLDDADEMYFDDI